MCVCVCGGGGGEGGGGGGGVSLDGGKRYKRGGGVGPARGADGVEGVIRGKRLNGGFGFCVTASPPFSTFPAYVPTFFFQKKTKKLFKGTFFFFSRSAG